MTAPPPIEQELRVLEAAMTECRRQLASARKIKDDLAADLYANDLNSMLDRWGALTQHGTVTP